MERENYLRHTIEAAQGTFAEAQSFAKEFGVKYPLLWDERDAVPAQYSLRGLPTSVFINRVGIIQRMQIGGMTEEPITESLKELMP